eukprot:TRINITY_DN865_c0_g2_i1.p1 TRINITY_DN865_c0_g2~~TRINITY_DN865_c0_g2_i1.p1  ORF type:complete len:357 (-),score=53.60 TRINITY_DN865_c0_g2_i1:88-1158(-)
MAKAKAKGKATTPRARVKAAAAPAGPAETPRESRQAEEGPVKSTSTSRITWKYDASKETRPYSFDEIRGIEEWPHTTFAKKIMGETHAHLGRLGGGKRLRDATLSPTWARSGMEHWMGDGWKVSNAEAACTLRTVQAEHDSAGVSSFLTNVREIRPTKDFKSKQLSGYGYDWGDAAGVPSAAIVLAARGGSPHPMAGSRSATPRRESPLDTWVCRKGCVDPKGSRASFGSSVAGERRYETPPSRRRNQEVRYRMQTPPPPRLRRPESAVSSPRAATADARLQELRPGREGALARTSPRPAGALERLRSPGHHADGSVHASSSAPRAAAIADRLRTLQLRRARSFTPPRNAAALAAR